MTSGEMLVRENIPWESKYVPQTVYWIPVAANFAAATALGAVVRNTLWKTDMVGDGREEGSVGVPYSLLCSMLMTGTVISTADCETVTLGAASDSDSSSESSESLSESWRVVPSQLTGSQTTR